MFPTLDMFLISLINWNSKKMEISFKLFFSILRSTLGPQHKRNSIFPVALNCSFGNKL